MIDTATAAAAAGEESRLEALLRSRRVRWGAVAVAVIGLVLVAWRAFAVAAQLRPAEGAGIVVAKEEARGGTIVLRFAEGGGLPIVAIANRVDAGDRVEKRAGELTYRINGAAVSPMPSLVGSLILFWLFMPAIALIPPLIIVGTRER